MESVYCILIRRLLYASTRSDTVIEKNFGSTLLQKLRAERDLTSGGRRETSHGRRQIQGRVNEGSNATVSEAKSSAEPPRRMKRKASVMWSRNSSSCDDVNDEAEGTEGRKFQKRRKARGP